MKSGSLVGNKYRLTRQIGEGAMGVVWAAVNEHTSREVALKLILRSTDDLRIRLLREARACGSLSHRNIIEVLDVGQTETGDPFLVMPLLSGETLAELLARQRRVEPSVAAQIGRDVARALAAAHAASIIHRDLKPANIFLHQEAGSEGTIVKVLDFGVSKNLASTEALATVVGGAVGSPAYMSPEQIRVDRDIDHRTDLWSLGVVLFEMLTGTRPFQGESTEVIQKVLVGDIPRVSKVLWRVDAGFDNLVAHCLERSRDRRVSTAAELAKLLNGYITTDESSRVYSDLPVRGSSPDLMPASAAMPAPSVAAPVSDYAPPNTRAGGFEAPSTRGSFQAAAGAQDSRAGGFEELDDGEVATVPVDLSMLGNLRRGPAPVAPVASSPAMAGQPRPANPMRDTMPSGAPRPVLDGAAAGMSPHSGQPSGGLPAIEPQAAATEPLNMGHLPSWRDQAASGQSPGALGNVPGGGGPQVGLGGTLIVRDSAPLPEIVGGGTIKMTPDMIPRLAPVPSAPEPEKASTTSAASVFQVGGQASDPGRSDASRLSERAGEERSRRNRLLLLGVGSAAMMAGLVVLIASLFSGPTPPSAATPEAAPQVVPSQGPTASVIPTVVTAAPPSAEPKPVATIAPTASAVATPPASAEPTPKPVPPAQTVPVSPPPPKASPPLKPTSAPPPKAPPSKQCGKLIKNCKPQINGI